MTDDKHRPPDLSSEGPTEQMPSSELPADLIPGLHLLQKLGEGGMGEVYEAEQAKPARRRRVALKFVKLGMDTQGGHRPLRHPSVRPWRLMSHPNIARVFDVGSHGEGPAVLRHGVLFQGVPVSGYCDTNHLGANERLELFVQICEGVQHAHQKGIIHRDIKPSNILVTEHPG